MDEHDIPIFLAGLAAAYTVLHTFLFLFFRESRGNLYYALFTAFQAGFFLALAQLQNPETTAAQSELLLRLLWTCGIFMCLFAVQFELRVFDQKRSLPALILTPVGLVLTVRGWLVPTEESIKVLNLFAFAICAEMLRLTWLAMHRRRPDAWIVGAGFAAMTLTGLYVTANNLGWISGYNPWAFPLGVVGLTVSMSAYLSKRMARASRKALEQERIAHRAEIESQRLAAENERQTAELEQARQLQLSMLPESRPDHVSVEIAFEMRTATEVGGDYYDYKQNEDGTLTVAVGDATGHGLDSGLLVASTKILFQSGDADEDLAETLSRISGGIKALRLRRMNFAMVLVRIEGRTLRVASAGMPPALVYRADAEEVEEVLLEGPPLGTLAGFRYREHRLQLAPGDAVLLASDGLPEQVDPDGEILGYERTRELFRQSAPRPPEEVLARMFSASSDFMGEHPLEDDLTMVVLRARL